MSKLSKLIYKYSPKNEAQHKAISYLNQSLKIDVENMSASEINALDTADSAVIKEFKKLWYSDNTAESLTFLETVEIAQEIEKVKDPQMLDVLKQEFLSWFN